MVFIDWGWAIAGPGRGDGGDGREDDFEGWDGDDGGEVGTGNNGVCEAGCAGDGSEGVGGEE